MLCNWQSGLVIICQNYTPNAKVTMHQHSPKHFGQHVTTSLSNLISTSQNCITRNQTPYRIPQSAGFELSTLNKHLWPNKYDKLPPNYERFAIHLHSAWPRGTITTWRRPSRTAKQQLSDLVFISMPMVNSNYAPTHAHGPWPHAILFTRRIQLKKVTSLHDVSQWKVWTVKNFNMIGRHVGAKSCAVSFWIKSPNVSVMTRKWWNLREKFGVGFNRAAFIFACRYRCYTSKILIERYFYLSWVE